MIIRTRKLPATSSDGERMRATDIDRMYTLTIPFKYGVADPHRDVAQRLANAMNAGEVIPDTPAASNRVFVTGES